MEILRSFGQKKIGYLQFDTTIPFDSVSLPCHKSGDCYIILFAGTGSTVISDFVEYKAEQDTFFFQYRLLINTDLTVKEIAAQLGYDDQSYFVRFFRIQTGKSPFEFKRIAIPE